MKTYLKQFIECHTGTMNLVLHIIGFTFIGIGIFQKSIFFVVMGAIVQESGHFYQYARTKNEKYSPRYCSRSQLIFAYPLLLLIILYILLTTPRG